MILHRLFENKYGTFGELTYSDGQIVHTLERRWADNQSNVSCVPPGVYALEPHASQRFGKTVALVNPALQVSHWRHGNDRFAILFHAANLSSELQGCIAVGMDIGVVRGRWAIVRSKDAMVIHREHLLNDDELEITPVEPL